MRLEDPLEASGADGALGALAAAGEALAGSETVGDAARVLARAVAAAARATVVVARLPDASGAALVAAGVAAGSGSLTAELEGSRYAAAELPAHEVDDPAALPDAARRVAERAGAEAVLLVPVISDGTPAAALELYGSRAAFSPQERSLARAAAYQLALAARALRAQVPRSYDDGVLAVAGEALAAAADAERTPEQVARLAADATGARVAALWRAGADGAPELIASHGATGDDDLAAAAAAAAAALGGRNAVVEETPLRDGATVSVCLQLGLPVVAVLQLVYPADARPGPDAISRLTLFGVRAAHALRASAEARTLTLELDRTRALLGVVAQAISELSLAHTLETAVERVADLLGTDRLAIYLRDDARLEAAAGAAVTGPHLAVAERLLDLALGPFRARGIFAIDDVAGDARLRPVAAAAQEAHIEGAIAVPLAVADGVIGLLAVYPPRGRGVSENESALLAALASQLAVAVQNAQLHERAKQQEDELKRALEAERQAAGQLRALYEISSSFTQYLAFDRTLEAVAQTTAEVLGADVAILRLPDDRRELLVPRAVHLPDEQLGVAATALLARPQPFRAARLQRLFRAREPFLLDEAAAREIGDELLVPFLDKGWTGAVVPVHTPTEVIGALEILSVRPGRPVTRKTVESAMGIAAQAALALDNARLYQQQKEFADTMQRSLLPHTQPELVGLELGAAYLSSARVDVGGDVYDFLELGDDRLAVVLGDVTGHGVDATADMAMAKFVFRSLAREHSRPSEFLAAANDVIVGEVATGKFVTMIYVVADGRTGGIACAGAGHPPPRIVASGGAVTSLDARGLALGIDSGQSYEEVRATLEPGGAIVLYTDGVIEARRERELFGTERLDRILRKKRAEPAERIAVAVLDECREYAGGELADDCAVVVLKRTA